MSPFFHSNFQPTFRWCLCASVKVHHKDTWPWNAMEFMEFPQEFPIKKHVETVELLETTLESTGWSFHGVCFFGGEVQVSSWDGYYRSNKGIYITVYIWRFVKMSVPGFVDKSQFHACRLMFAFKKHDLPWWRENVEILRYLWKSF